MASDNHGAKAQEKPQAPQNNGQQQAQEEQPQVSGCLTIGRRMVRVGHNAKFDPRRS